MRVTCRLVARGSSKICAKRCSLQLLLAFSAVCAFSWSTFSQHSCSMIRSRSSHKSFCLAEACEVSTSRQLHAKRLRFPVDCRVILQVHRFSFRSYRPDLIDILICWWSRHSPVHQKGRKTYSIALALLVPWSCGFALLLAGHSQLTFWL